MNEPDILAEAIAIAEGRTIKLARREHVQILLDTLSGYMPANDFELMKQVHMYPAPEFQSVRIVLPRGEA